MNFVQNRKKSLKLSDCICQGDIEIATATASITAASKPLKKLGIPRTIETVTKTDSGGTLTTTQACVQKAFPTPTQACVQKVFPTTTQACVRKASPTPTQACVRRASPTPTQACARKAFPTPTTLPSSRLEKILHTSDGTFSRRSSRNK